MAWTVRFSRLTHQKLLLNIGYVRGPRPPMVILAVTAHSRLRKYQAAQGLPGQARPEAGQLANR